MRRIRCSEIWGGIRNLSDDVQTSGVTASLYSGACDGGKGGDIYYFSVCDSDMLTRIALADVVGHGEAAAATSEWLYDALARHMNDLEGDQILGELNLLACEQGFRAMTTGAVAAFYTNTSQLYFAYAGHHPLLVRRKSQGQWTPAVVPDRPEAANLPLGVDTDVVFDQVETPLEPGDRLFLYTDGLIEAPDPQGRLFGAERLLALLHDIGQESLPEMKRAVLQCLCEHCRDDLSHDDVTFMAIEVN
jgi:sigma-B regulation protein RsbU (phosphoserine phosphatase)